MKEPSSRWMCSTCLPESSMAFDRRTALVSSSSCRDCGAGTDAEERSKYQIRKAMISR
jgi:hypothetical protein